MGRHLRRLIGVHLIQLMGGHCATLKQFGIDKNKAVFEKLGIRTEYNDKSIHVPAGQTLQIRNDYGNAVPKIDDAPWPAFPTDLMSIAITTATQCKGNVIFFEKMFEGRMWFVDQLIAMGAQIIVCDPHRVVVAGPSKLVGISMESPDIRAGMALLIAALLFGLAGVLIERWLFFAEARHADGSVAVRATAAKESVIDVVWAGDREPGADGKLPPVGNTVDVANATWSNTIGASELITVWADPDFDPEEHAFYYARVIEIPTPRWTAYEAKRFGITMPAKVP